MRIPYLLPIPLQEAAMHEAEDEATDEVSLELSLLAKVVVSPVYENSKQSILTW